MKEKAFWYHLLFPHTVVICLLTPISAAVLIYTMLTLAEAHPLRLASYILSFYTLTAICMRIPDFIHRIKRFKNRNKYISLWQSNTRLRVNFSLISSAAWNGTYAVIQLATGIYHNSKWFYSLFVYYALLAAMRLFLLRHTAKYQIGENIEKERQSYKICAYVFLVMNLAISAMMFFMIKQNRTVNHSGIFTIAMATYTFCTLTFAIINTVKYRKLKSLVVSAAKAVSLAAACVSVLTLENTMLTTFSKSDMSAETRIYFLALSGGAISIFIVITAIYMIIEANNTNKTEE